MNTYKKNINNIHDKSYKDLFSDKRIFVDFINTMVHKEWCSKIDANNIEYEKNSFILRDYEEQEADIVYKAFIDNKEVIFYMLLEFQSSVDYRMPLRLLFYINEIIRFYLKNNKTKNNKNFRVPAVIPLVIYNGTRSWTVPSNFRSIVENSEIFSENIINFKYEIFDINHNYTKEDFLNKQGIASAIFLLDQKMDADELIDRVNEVALHFKNITADDKRHLKDWLINTIEGDIVKDIVNIFEKSEEGADDMVANNRFVFKEFEEKTLSRGRKEESIKIAKNLLDVLDDKTIAEKTGLTVEEVSDLRK